MPAPGLSLVGFLSRPEADGYLMSSCVLAPTDDPATIWATAHAKLGGPVANAGTPDIQDITTHQRYLAAVQARADFNDTIQGLASPAIKLVEIDPLLAFQFHVFTDHSDALCHSITAGAPDLIELLTICLPQGTSNYTINSTVSANGVIAECDSPNVRIFGRGTWEDPALGPTAGAVIGVSSPLVQVVRFDGRCYLKNGYHRVFGARAKGATHVPCVFGDADDYNTVGANEPGFFNKRLLQSSDPPTMTHFTQGRAVDLTLRRVRRVMNVTWTQYLVAER